MLLMVLLLSGVAVVASDASLSAQVSGTWSDIPTSGDHGQALRQLDEWRIMDSTGCSYNEICPDLPISRWQMAVWMVRLLDNMDSFGPYPDDDLFGDITRPSSDGNTVTRFWWTDHVHRLRLLEVTAGCRDDSFCPDDDVTRAQMATFLTRAFDLAPAPSAQFGDTAGNTHEAAIDSLAAAGITLGCDTHRFCPDKPVKKAQMASFLYRAVVNAPQPTISSPAPRVVTGSFEIVIDFGGPVSGFGADDLWVVNGEASEPLPAGDAYRVEIRPSASVGGDVVVRVRPHAAHDTAGRSSRASEPFARTVACSNPQGICAHLHDGVGFDTWNRDQIEEAYGAEFSRPAPAIEWTGSTEGCEPGTTNSVYREALISRINWYRRMAGVPDVTQDHARTANAQLKALALEAAGRGTAHHISDDWPCYDQRAQTFSTEILFGGASHQAAIDGYIQDWGDSNKWVGHRLILLGPDATAFAIGQTDNINAIQHGSYEYERPARDGFVAWPSAGYVPARLVYDRWSFQDFWREVDSYGGIMYGRKLGELEVFDDAGMLRYRAVFDPSVNRDFAAWNTREDEYPYTKLLRPISGPLYRDACYTVVAHFVPDGAMPGGTTDYVTCLMPEDRNR